MPANAMRNFHVPLDPAEHDALREAAERDGRPATALAREAIREFLLERRRRQIAAELAAFAEAQGGTELDLDPALEAAGAEDLLARTEWEE